MFLGSYEKQVDGKRRLQIPHEFRSAALGTEHGVFCFLSIEDDCLEAGGDRLMSHYMDMIDDLPFGDAHRTAIEDTVLAGQRPLAFDDAGRVTLPESLCDEAGFGKDVVIVGKGARFQIWDRERWRTRREASRALARTALLERGEAARLARRGAKPEAST